MIVFLKGRRLWRYVTGDIPKPVPKFVTDSDSFDGNSVADAVTQVNDFEVRLEDWERREKKEKTNENTSEGC